MGEDDSSMAATAPLTIQVTFKGNLVPRELRKMGISKNLSMLRPDNGATQGEDISDMLNLQDSKLQRSASMRANNQESSKDNDLYNLLELFNRQ